MTSQDSCLPGSICFWWFADLNQLPWFPQWPASNSASALAGWMSALCPGLPNLPGGLRSQFCGCCTGKPFLACPVMRTNHRTVPIKPSPPPLLWPESSRVSQVVCTWEDRIIKVHSQEHWCRSWTAWVLIPDLPPALESWPSTYPLGTPVFSSLKLV